jgi:flagellin
MGLSVNTNVAALTVHRHLAGTGSTLATSLQRLSTGMRINSARDDAAGLAITERMTAQVRGNSMAARNANDGISFLQTAEGALASVGDNLMRMRDLAVQAGNSMMSDADRQALQAEVAQLKQEVDRISSSAKFNGEFIFDQSRSSVVGNLEQLAVLDGLQNGGWLADAERLISEQYGIKADGAQMNIEITTFTDGAGGTAAQVASSAVASGKATNITMQVDMADFVPPNLPNGGSGPFYNDRIIAHEMVHAVMARSASWGEVRSDANNLWFLEGAAEFIHGAEERVQADGVAATLADNISAWGGSSVDYSSAYVAMRYLHKQIQAAGGGGVQDMLQYLHNTAGKTLNDAFANATHGAYASQAAFLTDYNANKAAFVGTFNFSNTDTGAIGGFDVDGGPVKTAENIIPDYGSGRGGDVTDGFAEVFEKIAAGAGNGRFLSMQVGSNAGDSLTVSAGSTNLGALGLEAVDIATSTGTSMAALDRALEYVFRQRARVGAQMSRLENVIGTLDISNESLAASRGRMQDADFAAEAAQRSRTEILQQAGTAMMAQANSVPKLVLALLKF